MGSRRGVKVTYKVDARTAEKIAELAKATRRSKTGVIEWAVEIMWAQKPMWTSDGADRQPK